MPNQTMYFTIKEITIENETYFELSPINPGSPLSAEHGTLGSGGYVDERNVEKFELGIRVWAIQGINKVEITGGTPVAVTTVDIRLETRGLPPLGGDVPPIVKENNFWDCPGFSGEPIIKMYTRYFKNGTWSNWMELWSWAQECGAVFESQWNVRYVMLLHKTVFSGGDYLAIYSLCLCCPHFPGDFLFMTEASAIKNFIY